MSNVKALSLSSTAIAKRERATLAKHDEKQALYNDLFMGEEFAYIEDVAPIAPVAPVAPVNDIGQGFTLALVNALNARNSEVLSHDTDIAISYAIASHVSIDKTFDIPCFAEIASGFISKVRQSDRNTDKHNYIAVKVLLKVLKLASAISTGLHNELDNHTKLIGFQLAKLQNLTAKSALVTQTKSVTYNGLDHVQALDYKHTANYTVGTASTQTSSTRMLFNYLGMCEVIKGKKDDTIKVLDNARASEFIKLFE